MSIEDNKIEFYILTILDDDDCNEGEDFSHSYIDRVLCFRNMKEIIEYLRKFINDNLFVGHIYGDIEKFGDIFRHSKMYNKPGLEISEIIEGKLTRLNLMDIWNHVFEFKNDKGYKMFRYRYDIKKNYIEPFKINERSCY